MTDSPPEIAEMVSQISEAESEAELEALLDRTRGLSAALGREADEYLRKKGVHRKASYGADPEAIEDEWIEFLQNAQAEVESSEHPEPEQ